MRADAERVVATAIERFGGVDVVVNNAGMTAISDPDEAASITTITDEQWHASVARNLDTAFHVTRAAVPHMIERGYGRIVTVTFGVGTGHGVRRRRRATTRRRRRWRA